MTLKKRNKFGAYHMTKHYYLAVVDNTGRFKGFVKVEADTVKEAKKRMTIKKRRYGLLTSGCLFSDLQGVKK